MVSDQLRAVDRPGRGSSPSKLAKPIRFLVHDCDKRFGACVDEVFNAEEIESVRTRPAVTGALWWGCRGQSRRGQLRLDLVIGTDASVVGVWCNGVACACGMRVLDGSRLWRGKGCRLRIAGA